MFYMKKNKLSKYCKDPFNIVNSGFAFTGKQNFGTNTYKSKLLPQSYCKDLVSFQGLFRILKAVRTLLI